MFPEKQECPFRYLAIRSEKKVRMPFLISSLIHVDVVKYYEMLNSFMKILVSIRLHLYYEYYDDWFKME